MHGRMLIAHESRAVRSILRRRTLAEAPEFAIEEVQSDEEALAILAECSIDLVLCDETLVGRHGSHWKDQLRELGCTREPGFVYLISEGTTRARQAELLAYGACAFIDSASSAADILVAIEQVFDPRNHRAHRRVSIPGSQATIRAGMTTVFASVVNFSEAGMLCEFATPPNLAAIFGAVDVTLSFVDSAQSLEIDAIRARILRTYVVAHNAEHYPERLRGAWQFVNVPASGYDLLRRVVESAEIDAEPSPQSTFLRA